MGPGFVGLFSQSAGELTYSGYDLDTGQRQWSYPFPGAPAAVAQPVLMDSGSTLVSVSQFRGGVSLTEISKDGIELFSCELPIPAQSALLSSATLRNGRYTLAARLSTGTVVVLSFALPGFEPAPHGWVTAAGKMTRQGHAR